MSAVPTVKGGRELAARRVRLAGDPPSPVDPPPGCRFAGRCPAAQPLHAPREPALREVVPGHRVACHFVESRDGVLEAPLQKLNRPMPEEHDHDDPVRHDYPARAQHPDHESGPAQGHARRGARRPHPGRGQPRVAGRLGAGGGGRTLRGQGAHAGAGGRALPPARGRHVEVCLRGLLRPARARRPLVGGAEELRRRGRAAARGGGAPWRRTRR